MKTYSRLFACLAVGAAIAGSAVADSLKIGDPAPSINVARWLKGQPAKFGDQVQVVEFWATWCGPCKVSIPHLTEMAKKFKGKVNFTGVSVWEEKKPTNNSYIDKVATFVNEMGDKMDYNIAADGFEGTMAKTWMAAAGQNGIPAAFVIDKSGKIVWIGHPMIGLDEVLDQVVAGTYDVKKAAQLAEKQRKKQEEAAAMYAPLNKAVKAKDYKQAVIEIDKIIAAKPEMATKLAAAKFNFLLLSDETAAYSYGRELMKTKARDDAGLLNTLAWEIAGDQRKLAKPDYALAIMMAKRGVELTKEKDGFVLDTLAYAYFKSGDIDKAISTQEKALSAADKAGAAVPADTLKEMKDRLEQFKQKKKSGK